MKKRKSVLFEKKLNPFEQKMLEKKIADESAKDL